MATLEVVNSDVEEVQKKLQEIMASEITMMRELLSTMQEEQQATIINDVNLVKAILEKKMTLTEKMNYAKEKRLEKIKLLAKALGFKNYENGLFNEEGTIDLLVEKLDSDSCSLLSLRDQMIALLEKLTVQCSRNNYLLDNKVSLTRNLLFSIHPEVKNKTYDLHGEFSGKPKVKTMTLINHEV